MWYVLLKLLLCVNPCVFVCVVQTNPSWNAALTNCLMLMLAEWQERGEMIPSVSSELLLWRPPPLQRSLLCLQKEALTSPTGPSLLPCFELGCDTGLRLNMRKHLLSYVVSSCLWLMSCRIGELQWFQAVVLEKFVCFRGGPQVFCLFTPDLQFPLQTFDML